MAFPYTFEFTFDTTLVDYIVKVDWDNNGNFTGTYDNISSDVKSIRYNRGKDSELGKSIVGQCALTLKNSTGKYNPTNSSGDLYGNLKPKRPIQVYANYNLTDYPLFYGYIEEINPHPHLSEQDCVITSLDGLDYLARQDLETALLKNIKTGSVVATILDNAGWSSTQRNLDTGQDTVPYWYGHEVKSRGALEEIEDSELGFVYVNASGDLAYEDRHHRWSAEHQTSQFTFADTMISIAYSMNPKNIYNEIKATITPWTLYSSGPTLWQLEEVPMIESNQTTTFWGNADYFVDAWTDPVASTDYTANSASTGAGSSLTANISVSSTKFAQTIKLDVNNSASINAYITLLKVRGNYYDSQTTLTKVESSSASQIDYQKRTLSQAGKYMTDGTLAQDYCRVALARYKDPQPEITMTIVNSNTTLLNQILTRTISDRITVFNTKLGLNNKYYIDSESHDISEGGLYHSVTYGLKYAENEDFWVLDYSALASTGATIGQTKLGY